VIDATTVVAFQAFTGYYDLSRGGVSSKRKNAEFVGRVAADTADQLTYVPLDVELDPPKRGGERPDDWMDAADDVVREIDRVLDAEVPSNLGVDD